MDWGFSALSHTEQGRKTPPVLRINRTEKFAGSKLHYLPKNNYQTPNKSLAAGLKSVEVKLG
jgi:hypothetical protein